MKQLLLKAPVFDGTVSVISEGAQTKAALLDEFDGFTHEETITTLAARDSEANLAGRINGHLDQIEKDRTIVKAPFWQMCKDIDEAAKLHIAELKAAVATLSVRTGRFEVARRKAAAELEAQLKAKDVEAELQRLEAEKVLANGKDLKTQLEAQELVEKAAEQRNAIATERDTLAVTFHDASPAGRLQNDLTVTVNDPVALYKAFPNLVELKPRLGLIKSMIRAGTTLPGVTSVSSATFHAKAK